MDSQKIQRYGSYFLLVSTLVIACVLTWRSGLLVMRGETAVARCTSIDVRTTGTGEDRRTKTTWTVEFQTREGNVVSGKIDGTWSGLKVGDSIEVLYDPQFPKRVEANRFLSLWAMPLLFWVGVVVTAPFAIRNFFRDTTHSAKTFCDAG